MKPAILTLEEKEYINELCQETSAYICDHMNGMAANILGVYLKLENKNDINQHNLCSSHNESKTDACKNSFFIEIENIRRKKDKAITRIRGHLKNKTDNRLKWILTFQSYNLFKTKIFVQEILKENEGNCREHASLAYPFLFNLCTEKKCSTKINIRMLKGINFDHAFYALGKFQGCDFRKWPEDTIIYDPWLREQFPLREMPYHWCKVAYELNWGRMQKWPNVEEVMTGTALFDENHPFFSQFKFKKYLEFTTKPMLVEGHFEEYLDENKSENIIEMKL